MNNRTIQTSLVQTSLAALLTLVATGCGMDPSMYDDYNYGGQGFGSSTTAGSKTGAGGNYQLGSAGSIAAVPMEGYGPTAYPSRTIKANSRLRLRITAGVNDKNIKGASGQMTGYSYHYSKLTVKIQIGNKVYESGELSNGLRTASTSTVLDLSSDLVGTAACPKQAGATCRNDVTVWVGQPLYDFCQFQNRFGCALNPPAETHPWNVRVQFETDDTGSL